MVRRLIWVLKAYLAENSIAVMSHECCFYIGQELSKIASRSGTCLDHGPKRSTAQADEGATGKILVRCMLMTTNLKQRMMTCILGRSLLPTPQSRPGFTLFLQQLHRASSRVFTLTEPPIIAPKHFLDWKRNCLGQRLAPAYFQISTTTKGILLGTLISFPSAKPNIRHLGWLVDAAFEPDDCSIAQTQALDSISIPNECSSPSFTVSYYCIFRIGNDECHSSRVPTAAGHSFFFCRL